MEDIKVTFGNRVKELRLKKAISQEKLAELVDLDRTYIPGIEAGRRNVSLSVKMNANLVLLTFDTSSSKRVGVVKIKDVSRAGLHYLNNLSPYKQLFTDELEKVKIKINSLI